MCLSLLLSLLFYYPLICTVFFVTPFSLSTPLHPTILCSSSGSLSPVLTSCYQEREWSTPTRVLSLCPLLLIRPSPTSKASNHTFKKSNNILSLFQAAQATTSKDVLQGNHLLFPPPLSFILILLTISFLPSCLPSFLSLFQAAQLEN